MTVHDLLEYGEYVLREDKEYWAEMDRIKAEIDKLVYWQHVVMAAAIVRLAMIVERHSDSKCADCVGGSCEDCLEGKDDDEE